MNELQGTSWVSVSALALASGLPIPSAAPLAAAWPGVKAAVAAAPYAIPTLARSTWQGDSWEAGAGAATWARGASGSAPDARAMRGFGAVGDRARGRRDSGDKRQKR